MLLSLLLHLNMKETLMYILIIGGIIWLATAILFDNTFGNFKRLLIGIYFDLYLIAPLNYEFGMYRKVKELIINGMDSLFQKKDGAIKSANQEKINTEIKKIKEIASWYKENISSALSHEQIPFGDKKLFEDYHKKLANIGDIPPTEEFKKRIKPTPDFIIETPDAIIIGEVKK